MVRDSKMSKVSKIRLCYEQRLCKNTAADRLGGSEGRKIAPQKESPNGEDTVKISKQK